MRYTHSINAVKCQEWGLNLAQGALFDLINQANSWAKPHVIDGEVYYWMSRNKVVSEIPVAYSKTDTVYRAFKVLAEKELIHYVKEGKKDLVKMTEKGRSWNVAGTIQGDEKLGNKSESDIYSEINPTIFGNKSELTPDNSEMNPTYKSTTNKTTNNKKGYTPQKPELVSDQIWNDLLILRKETKSSNSQTAWSTVFNGLEKAQKKTGHGLNEIITFWIGKAWKGFNADWYLNAQLKNGISQPVNRSNPDPLAINAKWNVATQMTDEEKRQWMAGEPDSDIPSSFLSNNNNEHG